MTNLIYRERGRDPYYRIWHKLDKNMFILIESGCGSIVTRDKSYPMTRGTLCFIGEDKYHYTFPDNTDTYVRSKLFIPSAELSALLQSLSQIPLLSQAFGKHRFRIGTLNEDDFDRAKYILERLNQASPASDYMQAEAYAAVLQLAVLLEKNNSVSTSEHFGVIQRAVEYINDHITEPLTVDGICAEVYLSKYHFCRLFKEKVGIPVMEYVLKTRMMMAKELLRGGEQSVTEISETCGFSSISYFSRAFKHETGLTPLQYRKQKT